MVTRTIVTTTYSVMGMNTVSAETFVKDITLAGKQLTGKKALFDIQTELNKTDSNDIAVKVMSAVETETLYGMTETDFMKYANPMKEEQKKRASYKK